MKSLMKTLKQHINESIGDQFGPDEIRNWIDTNYDVNSYQVDPVNRVVNSNSLVIVKNKTIDRLMPDGWSWGAIRDSFDCRDCLNLKDLKGVPPRYVKQ